MRKRYDVGNCCFYDDCCTEKRKRCDNCCYPSYVDNQVIVRGPTGPMGPTGLTGLAGPAGPAGGTRPVSAHLVITQIQ